MLCARTLAAKRTGSDQKNAMWGMKLPGANPMGIAPTLSGIQNSSGLVSRKSSQKRGELSPLRRRHRSAAAACCARRIGSGHHTHVKKEFQIWNIKRGISFLAYPPQGCIRIRLINCNVVGCCVDELAVSSAAINHQIERPVACTTH